MSVRITADSTCDLSAELLERYSVSIYPLSVSLGDRTGKDGVNMTPEDIYAYVDKTGDLPKSSAVNVGEYADFFSAFVQNGDSLVHFSLGSGFSSTHQNACLAAEDFENVYVVDSANLSTGQGLVVIKAAEMAAAGKSAKEIYDACCLLTKNVEASFVLDNLSYLKKGGSIVMDEREIYSMPVLTGDAVYPHDAEKELTELVGKVTVIPASKIAEELGSIKAQNICLLGALVKQLGLNETDWEKLISESVPAKTIDINLAAFKRGYEYV